MKKRKKGVNLDYEEILTHLAPCGLDCSKCFAYSEGEIKLVSRIVESLLGSFDIYAERFSKFLPVFANYSSFKLLLSYLAHGDCLGCRKGTCKHPDCKIIRCYKIKGVDFCFQCKEFPCGKTNFDPDLKRRWIEMNRRMKEIGIEAYFEETKDLPRYK
jgi:hypothetical protein